MAQDKIKSLLWGLSADKGFSVRIVLTNDLDKLINSIKEGITGVEIVPDLKSVSQSAEVSIIIIHHHQTEDWYKQLDKEIVYQKEINHPVILLTKIEKEYKKTVRFMNQGSGIYSTRIIVFPNFMDSLVDHFGSIKRFCDFVDEKHK